VRRERARWRRRCWGPVETRIVREGGAEGTEVAGTGTARLRCEDFFFFSLPGEDDKGAIFNVCLTVVVVGTN